MRLIVLGSGAGGGIPQWNANNPISRLAFRAAPTAPRRMQASIALTSDGAHWAIVNAAPDLRTQIIETPALHPQGRTLRTSPIVSVVLTGSDIDQIAGLLSLRERQPFTLFATQRVLDILAGNRVFEVLAPGIVSRQALAIDALTEIAPGLTAEAISLPGKPPLYLEDPAKPSLGAHREDTIALKLTDEAAGVICLFAPSCARVTQELCDTAEIADVLLFDGTFFTDDEMIASGEGEKTARRMGHISVSGEDGSLAAFAEIKGPRKIYIHVNNTNPMAARDSAEAASVLAAGWEIAEDGLEIDL
jgi:pyrroloquinoline quinone biosynthesis protein B